MFRRALGDIPVTEREYGVRGDKSVDITRHSTLAADVPAASRVLAALRPKVWRESQVLDVQTTVAGVPEAVLDRLRAMHRAEQEKK